MPTVLDRGRPLAFRPHVAAHVLPDEGVFLVTERGVICLGGHAAAPVVQAIDGVRNAAQIESAVGSSIAVERLWRRGYLGYADSDVDARAAAWCQLAGTDGETAAARLSAARVAVCALGGAEAGPVLAALRNLGVRLVDPGDETDHLDLRIVLTDDYLHAGLAEQNRAALHAGTAWLLARTDTAEMWIGPRFRPGHTGCWQCLATRLQANRQSESYLRDKIGGGAGVYRGAALGVSAALGANLVAVEAARALSGVAGDADAHVLVFDSTTLSTQRHELVRRPQCAACGDPGLQARLGTAPVVITSRPKLFTADGGHRASSPEQMLATYAKQQSHITGVVYPAVPGAGTPDGLRVYVTGQNLARETTSLRALKLGLRSLSAGKGKTDAQARASALGEGIERYCGVFRGDEARRRATLAQIGEAAITPDRLLLFSQRQYEQRRQFVDDGSVTASFRWIPEPFDPTASLDWSPVWSLSEQRHRWIPTECLYYNASSSRFACADSNGNAAGTSLEDAILQGFLELVERDAVALWWYNRVQRPGVDLDAFADPYVATLRQTYAGLGRELWAVDLTSDFGVPVVGAFSRRVGGDTEDIIIAFGAHFDPAIALGRAVTELNQFVGPATLKPDDSGDYLAEDPEQVRWWRTATLANQPYLLPHPDEPASGPSRWDMPRTSDLADDVRHAQRLVEQRGLHLLVLDQTRPDVGLPVVKVIVPGMRHFWARFAPGRLYDVPVRLGWLDRPTPEAELNPIPIFI